MKLVFVANKNQSKNEMIDIVQISQSSITSIRYVFGQVHIDLFWPASSDVFQRLQKGEEVEMVLKPVIE